MAICNPLLTAVLMMVPSSNTWQEWVKYRFDANARFGVRVRARARAGVRARDRVKASAYVVSILVQVCDAWFSMKLLCSVLVVVAFNLNRSWTVHNYQSSSL